MVGKKVDFLVVAKYWSKSNQETNYYKYPCSKCKLTLSITRTDEHLIEHVVNKKEVYCSKCALEQRENIKQEQERMIDNMAKQRKKEEMENIMRQKEEKARLNLELLKAKYWPEKKNNG